MQRRPTRIELREARAALAGGNGHYPAWARYRVEAEQRARLATRTRTFLNDVIGSFLDAPPDLYDAVEMSYRLSAASKRRTPTT
jgi:hypothetical protein